MCSDLNHQFNTHCYIHKMLHMNLTVTRNQNPIIEKKKKGQRNTSLISKKAINHKGKDQGKKKETEELQNK